MEIVESKASRKRSERIGERITAECPMRGLHLGIVCPSGMGSVPRIVAPLSVSESGINRVPDVLEEFVAAVEDATAGTRPGAVPRSSTVPPVRIPQVPAAPPILDTRSHAGPFQRVGGRFREGSGNPPRG